MSTEIESYNRDTLLAMLHCRVVEMKYRKVDGEVRVMRGTLKEELVPKLKIDDVYLDKEERSHSNLVTLWDLDVNGWRSVRTDRIIDVL
jgi:hypothetical protein